MHMESSIDVHYCYYTYGTLEQNAFCPQGACHLGEMSSGKVFCVCVCDKYLLLARSGPSCGWRAGKAAMARDSRQLCERSLGSPGPHAQRGREQVGSNSLWTQPLSRVGRKGQGRRFRLSGMTSIGRERMSEFTKRKSKNRSEVRNEVEK